MSEKNIKKLINIELEYEKEVLFKSNTLGNYNKNREKNIFVLICI